MAGDLVARPSLMDRLRNAVKGFGFSGHPGPLAGPAMPVDDGWVPCAWPLNFGQLGWDPARGGYDSVVYACMGLYARTIAQLPGSHLRARDDNGTDRITNSALSRILRKPNSYQTRSDFMFNAVWSLLEEGDAYAVAVRNDRNEIVELHLVDPWQTRPMRNPETGDVFYSIGGNSWIEPQIDSAFADGKRWIVPSYDMMHVRAHCPRDPLVGESPLVAAGLAVSIHSGAQSNYASFAANESKPSGVLKTDMVMTAQQVEQLREIFRAQTTGVNRGNVPILTAGMSWQQTSMSNVDLQAMEQQKMAVEDIARIFGVPLPLIGVMTGSTFNNTEQLISLWLRQGLGFYVDLFELNFDQLFNLETKPDYTELDIDSLLRPDTAARIDSLVKGVQGAVYSPNEARAREGLPRVADGDMPRVQQQLVPLDWEPPPPVAAAPPAPDPAADPPTEPAADPPATDEGKEFAEFLLRRAMGLQEDPAP